MQIRLKQDFRMSAIAIDPLNRAVRFYEAPIGKKAVMAVTGVILFGYVVGHLLGNLQIYSSNPEQINGYAAFLHNPANVVPLWAIRAFLLAALILHITASVQLWIQNRAARPLALLQEGRRAHQLRRAHHDLERSHRGGLRGVPHSAPDRGRRGLPLQDVGGNPNTPDVRYNVIAGFQNPAVSGFYILAMILLCMHLYHGLWSMFQSLGFSHPRYTPRLKKGSGHRGHPDRHRQLLDSDRGDDRLVELRGTPAMPLDSKSPTGPIETRWDRHRFNLKLVNPANKRKHTIIVVGTGLAGGSAAAIAGGAGLQRQVLLLPGFPAARALHRRAGRHQRGQELSQRRRQRLPALLRHRERRRFPLARSQRLSPGADLAQHHRPVRGPGRAVRARILGLAG